MAVQSTMGEDGMLRRSQDPAYVRAMEEHIRQFDRMVGDPLNDVSRTRE